MCRVVLTSHGREHRGVCLNATWFDRDGDTVIVCVHEGNDLTKAPFLERTFSYVSWRDMMDTVAGM